MTSSAFQETEERQTLRQEVAKLASNFGREYISKKIEAGEKTTELWEAIGKAGYLGVNMPEEYGGGGGDILSYALAVEELARIDSSVAITMAAHISLGTTPIYNWGTEEQKAEWLPELVAGKKLAAFGLTEPEAGSDAGNTKTRA